MKSAYAFDADGAHDIEDTSTIPKLLAEDGTVVWVDLVNPSHEDLVALEHHFDLHPLALEDVKTSGQRPKLEVYPSHAFLVLYADFDGNLATMEELFVFIGPEWIITLHSHDDDRKSHFTLDEVRRRYDRTVGLTRSVGFLLYVILDEVVDSFFSIVDQIGDRLSELEDMIFAGGGDAQSRELPTQQAMLDLRRRLLAFRRKTVPLRDVLLAILRGEVPWIDEPSHLYFQDVFDHVLRISDEIDNQRELVGNAVDAHLALVSNRMNEIMKKMTSWGAILLGSTLIAGIYGMNFQEMPELRWHYGYYGALGAMLLLTLLLYRMFKKRNWL